MSDAMILRKFLDVMRFLAWIAAYALIQASEYITDLFLDFDPHLRIGTVPFYDRRE
jgi:hypothetical protein